MFIVGLTGGIGTGKSTVAKIFQENGVPVIDADLIAREVVQPGKPAWKKIRAEFGEGVFYEDGQLNRQALGTIIFENSDKRQALNKITHPEIHWAMMRQATKYLILGHPFVVMDLPLLFETGKMLNYIHKIITVTCEEDLQLSRIMDRNKLAESEAKMRIEAQMPMDKKCDMSHFVIENSGSMDDTHDQVIKVLGVLRASRHHWKLRGIIFATAAILFSGIAWLLNRKYRFMLH